MDEFAQWLRKLVRRYINLLDQTRFARALNKDLANTAGDKKFATVLLATYFAPTHHLIVCNAGHPPPLWYSHLAGRWEYLDQAAAEAGPSIRAERARYLLSPVANLPLGIIEPTEYRQFAAKLAMDDVVIIYTDAMTEARNPAGEMLGNRGLLELVQRTVRRIPGGDGEPEAPGLGRSATASHVSEAEGHELRGTTPDASPASVAAASTAQVIGQKLIDAVDRWRGGAPSEDDQTTIVLHHHGGPPPRMTLGRAASSMAKMLGLRWGRRSDDRDSASIGPPPDHWEPQRK